MASLKQLALKVGVLLLWLSLQHYLVNSVPTPNPDCTTCMKLDEKELVKIYKSRYPGAEFYSSSCLYLLHYMIPEGDSKSNATSIMPRYVGVVSSEERCLKLNKVVHDQECLNTSHPQYKNDSYCDWNYSLRYLGENHFPRYIVELKCNTSNSNRCRANRNDITVRVLKRLDGCNEEGSENWSNSNTASMTTTAGCSCVHVNSG